MWQPLTLRSSRSWPSLILENNYGKGMTLFLVTMMLYPLLVIA